MAIASAADTMRTKTPQEHYNYCIEVILALWANRHNDFSRHALTVAVKTAKVLKSKHNLTYR